MTIIGNRIAIIAVMSLIEKLPKTILGGQKNEKFESLPSIVSSSDYVGYEHHCLCSRRDKLLFCS
jgi:hypothetical protein